MMTLRHIHNRFRRGEKLEDLAKELGCAASTLRDRFHKHNLVKNDRSTFLFNKKRLGPPLGSMRDLCSGLPHPVGEWLLRETPEGASIVETIRAIIIDAYNDENGIE